jgi:hypothetical protein
LELANNNGSFNVLTTPLFLTVGFLQMFWIFPTLRKWHGLWDRVCPIGTFGLIVLVIYANWALAEGHNTFEESLSNKVTTTLVFALQTAYLFLSSLIALKKTDNMPKSSSYIYLIAIFVLTAALVFSIVPYYNQIVNNITNAPTGNITTIFKLMKVDANTLNAEIALYVNGLNINQTDVVSFNILGINPKATDYRNGTNLVDMTFYKIKESHDLYKIFNNFDKNDFPIPANSSLSLSGYPSAFPFDNNYTANLILAIPIKNVAAPKTVIEYAGFLNYSWSMTAKPSIINKEDIILKQFCKNLYGDIVNNITKNVFCSNDSANITHDNVTYINIELQFTRNNNSLNVLILLSVVGLFFLLGIAYHLGKLANRMTITFGVSSIIFAFSATMGSAKPLPAAGILTISDYVVFLVVVSTVLFTIFSVIGSKTVRPVAKLNKGGSGCIGKWEQNVYDIGRRKMMDKMGFAVTFIIILGFGVSFGNGLPASYLLAKHYLTILMLVGISCGMIKAYDQDMQIANIIKKKRKHNGENPYSEDLTTSLANKKGNRFREVMKIYADSNFHKTEDYYDKIHDKVLCIEDKEYRDMHDIAKAANNLLVD